MLNEQESTTSSFDGDMRHKLVEEFAVNYLNNAFKPNLAERNPSDGREVEYLMDAGQFSRLNRLSIWSYSSATGTGYQYRVIYRDRRFSDLDRLVGLYSGTLADAETDKGPVEQRLYELVVTMIKEGRLPKTFKIQPARDPKVDGIESALRLLGKSLEDLERRVKGIEESSRTDAVDYPPRE